MASVCFYFQVHQPYRIKRYRVFDVGVDNNYFNDNSGTNLDNKWIVNKVANKSYLPAGRLLKELLDTHPEFKISLSFSGVALEQFEEFAPEVIEMFQDLVKTGRVEILAETYHHSLAFFYSPAEFERQVEMHTKKVKKLFGVKPTVFRNTELSYTNDLGVWAAQKGFAGVITEGWEHYLGDRSPNFAYYPKGINTTKLLLKNYRLSDDMAFRFSDQGWVSWPLDADTYANWISAVNGSGQVVNLFMDFETLGEHQWESTGIFEFLKHLPSKILKHPDNNFMTVSEALNAYSAVDELDVPHILTWADTERDLSAWTGNDMQKSAIDKIYQLESEVLETEDKKIIDSWRKMQTSDHFYYMCTKWFADGDVHAYFNPYNSPYDAFTSFMNALNDLQLRVRQSKSKSA